MGDGDLTHACDCPRFAFQWCTTSDHKGIVMGATVIAKRVEIDIISWVL